MTEPAWTPPDGIGVHEFTVPDTLYLVQTPAGINERHTLGDGFTRAAHIYDPGGDARCWFLPHGSIRTKSWWYWEELSRYVTVHTGPVALPVPARDTVSGPGPHWVCPEGAWWDGTYVANASHLVGDLAVATLAIGKPGLRCHLCPAAVWPEQRASLGAPDPYRSRDIAHQRCAERAGYCQTAPGGYWEKPAGRGRRKRP